MTLNESWGFNRGDSAWKTPATIVNNLGQCAQGGGNYLLNIGPMPDGSVPPETVQVLQAVGKWLDSNGRAIYETERGDLKSTTHATFTRRGNTLYVLQRRGRGTRLRRNGFHFPSRGSRRHRWSEA